MGTHALDKLIALHGIDRHFIDAWGQPADISTDNLKALLAAMGYAVDNEEQLNQQLMQSLKDHWLRFLPPVTSCRQNQPVTFLLYCPLDEPSGFDWCFDTEQGEVLCGSYMPSAHEPLQQEWIDGRAIGCYQIDCGVRLTDGYHRLTLRRQGQQQVIASSRYVMAPEQAYKPPELVDGKKAWGVTVQLYALRSERNWGIGDFTDLAALVGHIADGGGDFVGVNPLHALYPGWPENASPYSPSSRRWLNIIYIDVEAVDEFAGSSAASVVASDDFQQRLAQLRRVDWVDYSAVCELKLQMLQRVFECFCQLPAEHPRKVAFSRFFLAGGQSLHAQATFDALQLEIHQREPNHQHWKQWPEPFRDYDSEGTTQWANEHANEVRFFAWLQWLADEQLFAAEQVALRKEMAIGLFCDVAVGVASGSQEAWRNRDVYNLNSHVGAPPDVLGPLGQDWGLPPMEPWQLAQQGYQPLIDLFEQNMHSCGALRIDHVMGLLRLWWIPVGKSARDGAYVEYPLDDLLTILVLESHRNRCLVVGEDLGTVPPGIFETLQCNGIHSYRVFFFSQAADGGFISPHDYPKQALSALTTHDMATLRGFWHCEDLKLGKKLGLYPDPERLKQLFDQRHYDKQQILDSLHGHHAIPETIGHDAAWVPMDRQLNRGMQLHMARGCSALLSLQLEDWLDMELPVNVPGTSWEYPNWRRKLSRSLNDIFSDPDIQSLMEQLTEARR